ncbi:hypothetical protein Patl1_34206 [Pistacia atlantica]|uniref:Uncharacterized protein n=1 Tax=Pistacia atlantica TaxID=434234 RepID=A0ACC0ZU77_9ROSI|nr:hypothetical protein Patl1_34206 [Pistacia atlantica]
MARNKKIKIGNKVRPSRARALMSSYTPPPPEVVDGWQPETEDQSQGLSSY